MIQTIGNKKHEPPIANIIINSSLVIRCLGQKKSRLPRGGNDSEDDIHYSESLIDSLLVPYYRPLDQIIIGKHLVGVRNYNNL